MLSDNQEVVRNEALLLMVGLTHASAEIKQFAAFEGAFESLVKIIRQEGSACLLCSQSFCGTHSQLCHWYLRCEA